MLAALLPEPHNLVEPMVLKLPVIDKDAIWTLPSNSNIRDTVQTPSIREN